MHLALDATFHRPGERPAVHTNTVTDAELGVLEVLWQRQDGATVREIVLAVYGRHEHSLHGGVKSFLDRLMEKGFVKVDKGAFAHRFQATVTRSEFVGHELRHMANSHFGGSLRPLMLSLVEQSKLTRQDRAAIQALIDNMKD